MIILTDSNIEAYQLHTSKRKAKDIISGKRNYELKPMDMEHLELFVEDWDSILTSEILDTNGIWRKISAVRFCDDSLSWFLDVEIKRIGIANTSSTDLKFLSEKCGFGGLDESI